MVLDQLYTDYRCMPYTYFKYNISNTSKTYIFEILYNVCKKIISTYEFTYILTQRYNLFTSGNKKINFSKLGLPELPNNNMEITNENEYSFLINNLNERRNYIKTIQAEYFDNTMLTLKNYNFDIIPVLNYE